MILAIDPQYRFCGFALIASESGNVCSAGTEDYRGDRDKDAKNGIPTPIQQCDAAAKWLRMRLCEWDTRAIAIELPDWIKPGGGNQTAAAICKVSAVAGALALEAQHYVCTVRLVQPREWKGRKKKEATALEVAAHMKVTPTRLRKTHDQHAIDAIGLGLWAWRNKLI